jgi:hypothetical protein
MPLATSAFELLLDERGTLTETSSDPEERFPSQLAGLLAPAGAVRAAAHLAALADLRPERLCLAQLAARARGLCAPYPRVVRALRHDAPRRLAKAFPR